MKPRKSPTYKPGEREAWREEVRQMGGTVCGPDHPIYSKQPSIMFSPHTSAPSPSTGIESMFGDTPTGTDEQEKSEPESDKAEE